MRDSYQRSCWDRVPSEIILLILSNPVLSTLEMINFAQAYPATIRPLLLGTPSLWRCVHLPFPDPGLFNYPGWRQYDQEEQCQGVQDDSQEERSKVTNQQRRHYQPSRDFCREDRCRFLPESEFFEQADIQGDECDLDPTNTLWIILDVLDRIPLEHVRHLSFDSPPCLLCTYPCRQLCSCECHQYESRWTVDASLFQPSPPEGVEGQGGITHTRSMASGSTQHPFILASRCVDHSSPFNMCASSSTTTTSSPSSNIPVSLPTAAPNSSSNPGFYMRQRLQELTVAGLVDFSRHIDVPSMYHVLDLGGIHNRRHVRHDDLNGEQQAGMTRFTMDVVAPIELDLDDALLELYLLDMEEQQGTHEMEADHTLSRLDITIPLVPMVPTDAGLIYGESTTPAATVVPQGHVIGTTAEPMEVDSTPSSTPHMRDHEWHHRQQAETKAAYQRARLLIRILSSGRFQALETLRVPWWPATRIYTIRQQLEKWSRAIEETVLAQQTRPEDGAARGRQQSVSLSSAQVLVKWRKRWTNQLELTDSQESLASPHDSCYLPMPSLEVKVDQSLCASVSVQQLPLSPSARALSPHAQAHAFPLKSLRVFRLRTGGELMNHEVQCLSTSALILAGLVTTQSPSSCESAFSQETPTEQLHNTHSDPGGPHHLPQSQRPHSHRRLFAPRTAISHNSHWTFEYCHLCGVQYLRHQMP